MIIANRWIQINIRPKLVRYCLTSVTEDKFYWKEAHKEAVQVWNFCKFKISLLVQV